MPSTRHVLSISRCSITCTSPCGQSAWLEALRRAERHLERRDASARLIEPSSVPLLLQGRRGVRVARLSDLLCITARDDHSELYLIDGSSYFDPTHMDDWERWLPASFVRTH